MDFKAIVISKDEYDKLCGSVKEVQVKEQSLAR